MVITTGAQKRKTSHRKLSSVIAKLHRLLYFYETTDPYLPQPKIVFFSFETALTRRPSSDPRIPGALWQSSTFASNLLADASEETRGVGPNCREPSLFLS
jgi:hypothetical protein